MKKKFDRTANTQAQEYTQQLDMNWFSAGFHKDQYDVFRGEPLFRGDSRGLQILKEGFEPWGTNTDLISHLGGGKDSAFIPASIYLREAIKFPFSFPDGSALSHVFEIHTYNAKINIAETLANLGLLPRESVSYRQIAKFGERAIIGNVKFSNIYCAWPVDIFDAANVTLLHPETPNSYAVLQRGTYRVLNTEPSSRILNPDYKPPTLLIWKPIHIGCHVLTAGGVVLDIGSLYGEFRQSRRTGNYKNTIRKTISIASGWPGAYVTGSYLAGQTFLYTAPLSPLIQAGCTLTAGLGGSVCGYLGASHFATRLYDSRNVPKAVELASKEIRLNGLTCQIKSYNDGSSIGKCQVNKTKNSGFNPRVCRTTLFESNRNDAAIVSGTVKNNSDQEVATPPTMVQSSVVSDNLYERLLNSQLQPLPSALALPTRDTITDNIQQNLARLTQSNPALGNIITHSASPEKQIWNNVNALTESRHNFSCSQNRNRCDNLSQFTNKSRPTHFTDSANQAAIYNGFFSQYLNMHFSERPRPVPFAHSFFVNNGSDHSGRYCDSRLGNCSAPSTTDCRSGNSDRCPKK